MKTGVCFTFLLLVSVGFCFGQSATNSIDTGNGSPALEMVPTDKLVLARELLAQEGILLPATIAGMAFEPGAADHTGLIVISLDQNLDPVKNIFTVKPDFYSSIITSVSTTVQPPQKSTPGPTIQKKPVANEKQQTGRLYFIASTVARTWMIYPASFSTLLNSQSERTQMQMTTGLSLLTFGASLYSSYQFTKNRELGYGRVAMMNYGGELGPSYAFLVSQFLKGLNIFSPTIQSRTEQVYNINGPTDRDTIFYDTIHNVTNKIFAVGSMIGFPAGIYLGSKVNFAGNYQYGNINIMRFLGRSGWLYGYLLPLYSNSDDENAYLVTASCLTIGLIPGGFYLGHRLIGNKDYSSGRGFMIETSGIMGGLTGSLVPGLFDRKFGPDNERRFVVTSILVGHALGTTLGFTYKPQNSYSFFQGVFTAISAGCGAALGLSIPFLAQADSDKGYIAAALLGGWGGFFTGEYLAKSLFEVSNRDQKLSQIDVSIPLVYQWPIFLATAKSNGSHATSIDRRADLITASVNF